MQGQNEGSGASRHSGAFIYGTAAEYRLKATGAVWPSSYRHLAESRYKAPTGGHTASRRHKQGAQQRALARKACDGCGVGAKKSIVAANDGHDESKGAFARQPSDKGG